MNRVSLLVFAVLLTPFMAFGKPRFVAWKNSSPTPTPTATPSATPTATPTPTPTPTPLPGLTVSVNWGEIDCSGATSCASTSAYRTLVGGSATLAFARQNTHQCQYSKNGGAFTDFSDGATLACVGGDSLAFKIKGIFAGDSETITVTDSANGSPVGTFTAKNTHAP